MRTEGGVDRELIRARTEAAYGLKITDMRFIPKGEVGYGYVLTLQGGAKRFVKAYVDRPQDRLARLDLSLRTAHWLRAERGMEEVVAPLPNLAGALRTAVEAFSLVLFPYAPGHDLLGIPLTLPQASALLCFLACLHAAGEGLPFAAEIPADDYGTAALETAVRELLAAARRPSSGAWQARASTLILDNERLLLETLELLHASADRIQRLPRLPVLCHTDASDGNLVADGDRIAVIDWETVTYSRPEHDLWMHLLSFREGYEPAYRLYPAMAALEPAAVDFMVYRRYLRLRALTWGPRLLSGKGAELQDASDFGYLADTFERLPRIPEELKGVARFLAGFRG